MTTGEQSMLEGVEVTSAENTGVRRKGWFLLSAFGIGHSVLSGEHAH